MATVTATERTLTLAIGLGASLAISGWVVACSDDSTGTRTVIDASVDGSIDEAGASDAGSEAASCARPGSFGSTKCNTCVETSCCAQLSACAADPQCKTISECVTGCIDDLDAGGCARACFAATPDDAGMWKALEKCVFFSKPCDFECSTRPNQ